jgi:hypothetical protein
MLEDEDTDPNAQSDANDDQPPKGDGESSDQDDPNSAGEDGGKSDTTGDDKGSGDGQQGEDGDGEQKDDGKTEDPPQGESLLDLFRKDPQAQALVRQQAQEWVNSQQSAAAAQKAQQEIDGLIEDEDWEELGKRWAKDTVTNRAGKQQADAALQEAFGNVYQQIFALPELQNLTDEEKAKIDASKFTSDADYIPALLELVVEKRSGTDLESRVNDMLNEKLTALKNMADGKNNASGGSGPNVPSGSQGKSLEGKSSRELLTMGLSEELEKAGYPSGSPDDD